MTSAIWSAATCRRFPSDSQGHSGDKSPHSKRTVIVHLHLRFLITPAATSIFALLSLSGKLFRLFRKEKSINAFTTHPDWCPGADSDPLNKPSCGHIPDYRL